MQIEKCQSITQVRENIDNIDQQIVALIAKRGEYVKQAAQFKKSTNDVKAPNRVEEVIAKVIALAKNQGANLQVIENVYRAMIAAFVVAEMKEYEENVKIRESSF